MLLLDESLRTVYTVECSDDIELVLFGDDLLDDLDTSDVILFDRRVLLSFIRLQVFLKAAKKTNIISTWIASNIDRRWVYPIVQICFRFPYFAKYLKKDSPI